MAQHRRNGPAVVARSGRRHWQRGQGRWGCSETHACVVRRRTHRRGWLSAAEVQDGAHRGCRPSSECGGVGPSLGRPRTLNGGQQRPTTTTRRTSPHRLTSENPAHQDPRQDPGQEEVALLDHAPVPRSPRGAGACSCAAGLVRVRWAGSRGGGPVGGVPGQWMMTLQRSTHRSVPPGPRTRTRSSSTCQASP